MIFQGMIAAEVRGDSEFRRAQTIWVYKAEN
jgi:hypothetical protein